MSQTDVKNDANTEERYLAFSLCQEHYAIPLIHVKEVIASTETTPIPYTPPHFKGIMNLRGQVISVIDLRVKFKMSKAEYGPETSIVIMDLAPLCLGIVVDSVNSVLALKSAEIQPAPDVESSIAGNYLTGVARKDKNLILLLDVMATLNVEDLKALKKQRQDAA